MNTKEIADRLVELNKNDDHETCYKELYSDDIVSVENWGDRQEYRGMEALKKKGEEWMEMVEEMHETRVSEPLVADQSFAVTFYMDVTFKPGTPEMEGRVQLTELAIYRVNGEGKIFHEEFWG